MQVAVVISCVLALAVAASACTQVPGDMCSRTIGYWNAPMKQVYLEETISQGFDEGNLPIAAGAGTGIIMLGSHIPITNVAQAMYVLSKGGNSDNSIQNMMAQLLAALLNQRRGSWIPTTLPSDGSPLCQIEADALNWLDTHVTSTPTDWNNPQTGMRTPTAMFFDNIETATGGVPASWAMALDNFNKFGDMFPAISGFLECWDGQIDPVTLPPEDSCVDLPHGFECDKPHEDLTGVCLEVVTSTSLFRATEDHLIHTPEQGWRLVRELKKGDVLRTGLVESITETVCKSLNSCRTADKRFDAFGEVFAQNALITPDNYQTMLMD